VRRSRPILPRVARILPPALLLDGAIGRVAVGDVTPATSAAKIKGAPVHRRTRKMSLTSRDAVPLRSTKACSGRRGQIRRLGERRRGWDDGCMHGCVEASRFPCVATGRRLCPGITCVRSVVTTASAAAPDPSGTVRRPNETSRSWSRPLSQRNVPHSKWCGEVVGGFLAAQFVQARHARLDCHRNFASSAAVSISTACHRAPLTRRRRRRCRRRTRTIRPAPLRLRFVAPTIADAVERS
jgi:hypothetical protein